MNIFKPLRIKLLHSVAALAAFALAAGPGFADTPLYKDSHQPVEARVSDLLGRMTLDEKIALVHADSKFTTAAIPRLGIPRRWMSDGPHGVREDIGPDTWDAAGRTDDFATWMPVGINLAATWNPDMAQAYGTVIGQEALERGKQIMLGPGVNIMRTPLNGRNYEYFGEDPYLAARMAVGYVHGVQSQGVASCVKHFAGNNQERQRGSIDVEMDERTMREIYLPPFKAAVQEGGALAVMSAYNKFDGQYCSQNDLLLNTILKGEWGFQGLVMSDWSGVHDTRGAVLGGMDLEMGTVRPYDDYYLARPFREGIEKGFYPVALLDDKVRRNLREMFRVGAFDGRGAGSLNTAAHQAAARQVAEEGIVLLKNQGDALPLDASKIRSIAVIGEDAVQQFASGGQSAGVKAFYEITPLAGLVKRVGPQVDVTFSMGYRQPARRGRRPANATGGRPAAVPGAADAAGVRRVDAPPPANQPDPDLLERAVRAARLADVAIVIAGLNHSFDSEGSDRLDMKLPYGQDELIRRVAEANPRTIVVLMSGGPVEMSSWLPQVPAVVQAWYPGMEGGNALAGILFGDVNPSGKLPCTFPRQLSDSPASALGSYPGSNGVEPYTEGLLVGYRWFDTKKIEPLFPFGYGLSYTRFAYSGLRLVRGPEAKGASVEGPVVTAAFEISNVGTRTGGEVAQLYVHQEHSSLPRPLQELKGFRKVFLKPGETQTVTIPLDQSAFAFFDPASHGWRSEKGNFTLVIGSSSRDVRLRGVWKLPKTTLVPLPGAAGQHAASSAVIGTTHQ